MRVRTFITGAVIVLAGVGVRGNEPAEGDISVEALVDEVHHIGVSDVSAAEMVERYGRGTDRVQALAQLLNDVDQTIDDRWDAAMILSIHGGEEARKVLVDYIESPQPAVLTYGDGYLLGWVIGFLGHINDDVAIDKLKEMAGAPYWNSREPKPITEASKGHRAQDAYETQYWFREKALVGICRTNRPDTIEIMKGLVDDGVITDMHPDLVESFITEATRVSDVAKGIRVSDESPGAIP